MASSETFDDLIFGGGKAGKTLAMDLAKSGRRVAMVERGLIGGSCINVACIPTKTVVRSAKVADLVCRAREFGILAEAATVSIDQVRRRKRDVVAGMIAANQSAFDASGMTLIIGEGKFVGPKAVEVVLKDGSVRRLNADRVFINTGTRAAIPNSPGMQSADPLTHVTALELDQLPEHLIVLGGGFIGLEFAQAYRRFGSKVTIVQRNSRLAPREDADVSDAVAALLREEGVEVLTSANIAGVEGKSGDSVRLRLKVGDKEQTLEGSHLLAAAGRTPNTDGIGLDLAGVALDDKGFVKVNERLATSAPNVWAMGDVAGSPMFTHISLDDYRVVKSALTGGTRTTKGRLIPSCVFIDPELGRVGLSESEANTQGIAIKIAKLPMAAVPRARTIGETRGFMKAVIDASTDHILGFTMLGAEAGEVIAAVQIAMLAKMPYTDLRDGIFAHPTLVEGLNQLFATAK